MKVYDIREDLGAFGGLGFMMKTAFAAFRNRLRLKERILALAQSSGDREKVPFP
jgi:hypothetical protein